MFQDNLLKKRHIVLLAIKYKRVTVIVYDVLIKHLNYLKQPSRDPMGNFDLLVLELSRASPFKFELMLSKHKIFSKV